MKAAQSNTLSGLCKRLSDAEGVVWTWNIVGDGVQLYRGDGTLTEKSMKPKKAIVYLLGYAHRMDIEKGQAETRQPTPPKFAVGSVVRFTAEALEEAYSYKDPLLVSEVRANRDGYVCSLTYLHGTPSYSGISEDWLEPTTVHGDPEFAVGDAVKFFDDYPTYYVIQREVDAEGWVYDLSTEKGGELTHEARQSMLEADPDPQKPFETYDHVTVEGDDTGPYTILGAYDQSDEKAWHLGRGGKWLRDALDSELRHTDAPIVEPPQPKFERGDLVRKANEARPLKVYSYEWIDGYGYAYKLVDPDTSEIVYGSVDERYLYPIEKPFNIGDTVTFRDVNIKTTQPLYIIQRIADHGEYFYWLSDIEKGRYIFSRVPQEELQLFTQKPFEIGDMVRCKVHLSDTLIGLEGHIIDYAALRDQFVVHAENGFNVWLSPSQLEHI